MKNLISKKVSVNLARVSTFILFLCTLYFSINMAGTAKVMENDVWEWRDLTGAMITMGIIWYFGYLSKDKK